jgi:hypothetical protein
MRHFRYAMVALGGLSLMIPSATAARAGSVYQQVNRTRPHSDLHLMRGQDLASLRVRP